MPTAPAQRPVVVFAHVHYPEVWQGMARSLAERLHRPFHLVATTAGPEDAVALPRTDAMLSARVMRVENRGRDVLPFLRALPEAGAFDVGLKLHTKKSPQRLDGDAWRDAVLGSLLPIDGAAGTIIDAMRAEPRAGFVAPGGFALGVRPWVLQNGPGMAALAGGLGMTLADGAVADADMEDCFLAAGSMFWFRREALAGMAGDAVTALFEPEDGQLDGTAAHAGERMFPVAARRQGFVSLSVPALLLSRPEMDRDVLLALARRHADVPSTFFPAPYVAELPPGTALPDSGPMSDPVSDPVSEPASGPVAPVPRWRDRTLRRAGRLLPGAARDRLRRLLWPPGAP